MTRRTALAMATCRALNRTWFSFDRTCCTLGPKLRRAEFISGSNVPIQLAIVYFRGPTSRYMAD